MRASIQKMALVGKETVEWRPASLLQESTNDVEDRGEKYALIVLNQPIRDSGVLQRLWTNGLITHISLLHVRLSD